MNVRTAVSMVALLVISVLAVAYMRMVGLHVNAFDDDKTATMPVQDTNGMVVGAKVLMRGVPIGEVTHIRSDADKVEITWSYDRKVRIPADTVFRVDNLSALGEPYVAVLPATADGPYLSDDAQIDQARVTVPTSVKDLSVKLSNLLDQIDPEQLRRVFAELNTGLPNDQQPLADIRRAGALLSAMLRTNSSDLTTLLTNAQSLLLDSDWLPPGLRGTTDTIAGFSYGLGHDVMRAAYDLTIRTPLPDSLRDGTGPLIAGLQHFLDKAGVSIATLSVTVLPAATEAAAALQTINLGRLLDSALAATSAGDNLTVHIGTQTRTVQSGNRPR